MRRHVASDGAANGSRNPNGASVSTLPPRIQTCAKRVPWSSTSRMDASGTSPTSTPRPAASAAIATALTGSGKSVAPATQPRYSTNSARMATTKAGWPPRAARHAYSAAAAAAMG